MAPSFDLLESAEELFREFDTTRSG